MPEKVIPGLPLNSQIVNLGIKENLSPSEVLLLFVLRMRMNVENRKCWPSQKTLAKEVRVSEKWIRSMIQKLVKMGIIRVSKKQKRSRYGNNLNEYQFVFPWKTSDSSNLVTSKEKLKPEFSSVSNVNKTELSTPNKSELSSESNGNSVPVKPEVSSHHTGTQFASTGNSVPVNKDINNEMNKQVRINSSSINQESDDEISKPLEQPRTIHQDEHDCNIESDTSNKSKKHDSLSFEESARPLPRKLKRGDLKKFYGRNIPKARDLNERSNGFVNLSKYVSPFRQGSICIECFGSDFSQRMPSWWERQFEDYYSRVIELHWKNYAYKPGEGFKTQFRRACVAGAMKRNGFNPLTPKEQEKKRKQDEKEKRELQIKLAREAEQKEKAKIEKQKIKAVILKNLKQLSEEVQNQIAMEFDHFAGPDRKYMKNEVDFIYWNFKKGESHIAEISIAEILK